MALHHVKRVVRPSTLEGAWSEKTGRGSRARFLAGGIDVVLYTPPKVDTLIDLAPLDLSGVKGVPKAVTIGAMTTMTEAVESPAEADYADGLLVRVLRQVASPLQRNLATLGGTLGSAHPWSDVIPALLVLDAELTIYDGTERTVSLEEHLKDRRALDQAIICDVRLPEARRATYGAFAAFTRTAFDIPLLNVACLTTVEDDVWQDVRMAVGGTPALATRLRAVEQDLARTRIGEAESAVAASASEAIDARDDLRASAGYRRRLARVLVARCLAEMSRRIRGSG